MWIWQKSKSTQLKSLGQRGEEYAQTDYKRRGYKILAANFFNKKGKQLGEVDFVARNKTEIVFIEVKTRATEIGKFGSGAEAVNVYKQQKLLKAVKLFLAGNPKLSNLQPRIDVCEIVMGELDTEPKSVKILVNAVEDSN